VLMVTRVHYVIDFIGAIVVAAVLHRLSEKLAFYYDVRICGYRANKRDSYYFTPCKKCGWSNLDARKFNSSNQLEKLV